MSSGKVGACGLMMILAGCSGEPDTTTKDSGSPPTDTDTDTTDTDTDTTDTGTPTTPGPERRYDCSGIDPADPAPLGGRVFLTFDDGPDLVDTPAIMETLRSYDVPATFFVLGVQLSEPDSWPIVEDMVADPLFDVANHSWSHADLADLSTTAVAEEMDDTTALIETFGVSPTFFRFPYGDSTCTTVDMAVERSYRVAGWHVDTADWCYAVGDGTCTTEDYWRIPAEHEDDMIGLTMEQIRRFDGGVVLLHDIHTFTAEQLPILIEALLAEGFTFAALDDASALPNLNAGTPEDLPYLGEGCDTSDDRCWQVEFQSWCEPALDPTTGTPTGTAGVCTLPCEGLCPDRDGAAVTFCADIGGAGQCVGRSASQNGYCEDLPGTTAASYDRFGEPPATATVCAPSHW